MTNQEVFPPEILRQILSEAIRSDLPQPHHNTHPHPPTTRLSHATRDNALRMLYRESIFYLAVNRYTPTRTPVRDRYRRHHLDPESRAFLQHTTAENAAHIRHLDLLLCSPVGGSWRSNLRFDAMVVVPLNAGPGALAGLEWNYELGEYGWDEDKYRKERREYEGALRVVLDRVAGAWFTVTKENLLALCEDLSRALPGSQAVSLAVDLI